MASEACRTCGLAAETLIEAAGPGGGDITRTPLCADCAGELFHSIMNGRTLLNGTLSFPACGDEEGVTMLDCGCGHPKLYGGFVPDLPLAQRFGYAVE